MRPLLKKELSTFCKRFDNFRDSEIRLIEIISPVNIKLILAVQDSARDFDWITIHLDFNGVEKANLIDQKKLSLIDTTDGCSIIETDESFAFGIGECYNADNIKNSTMHIISKNLKYIEGEF